MVQPRTRLISSFILKNGTIHLFVQYAPRKRFNNFVQSAVDAQQQGDGNPNSSVVAETMKLLTAS